MTDVTIIPNKWIVRIDSLNHQLVKYTEGGKLITKGDNKGQLTEAGWKALGIFHPNMEQSIRKIISLEMEDTHEATLKGYLAMQEDTTYNITKMIKEAV